MGKEDSKRHNVESDINRTGKEYYREVFLFSNGDLWYLACFTDLDVHLLQL
jgi:hypothetical protein